MPQLVEKALMAVLVSCALNGFRGDSYAQSFTPIQPPACPAYVQKDWVWEAVPYDSQGVTRHYADPYLYHNNQYTVRYFVANPYVRALSFLVDDREMMTNDKLTMKQIGLPPSHLVTISGVSPTNTWYVIPSNSLGDPIEQMFLANGAGGGSGFKITKVEYCGGLPGASILPIGVGKRYQGIVLGANDTLYFTMAGAAPGQRTNIAVWDGTPAAPNVDVYARCNALPTPTAFLKKANTATSREFIFLTSTDCSIQTLSTLQLTPRPRMAHST